MFLNNITENNKFEQDKANSDNVVNKKQTIESLYRFTYNKTGIYNAFRKAAPKKVWDSFLKSDAANWLPDPPSYGEGYKSFFKREGFELFIKNTLPVFSKYLDMSKVLITEYESISGKLFYEDNYQVVFATTDSDEKVKSEKLRVDKKGKPDYGDILDL